MPLPESLIATHSGLRGRPGVDLTEDVIESVVRRFVTLLQRLSLPLHLGSAHDDRPEGGDLAALVVETARRCGVDVVDFGAVSTPVAKHASRLRRLGGAVVVTGSHLEPAWNGLKLVVAPSFGPFDVRKLPDEEARVSAGRVGSLHKDHGAVGDHAAAVCASVDAAQIRAAGLKVTSVGGVGGGAALMLEGLGCHSSSDRRDAGLLLDADGDRLQLVDENGTEVDPEVVLPLVALACGATVVVKGADTSRMVDDLVQVVHLVSPGELHLVEALAQHGADVAGEGNGGAIVPAVGLARDALAAAAAVLALIARKGRPLSALVADLPHYARLRSDLPCEGAREARAALRALADALRVDEPANPEDGLRVQRAHGAWGLVRQSATEPVLRLTAEARGAADVAALHTELRELLVAGVHA
jgi:phosphomannomutase